MRLKVRSPRQHRPATPRNGMRVGAALTLALLLLNLLQIQARPSESALADLHARGACACCGPDVATEAAPPRQAGLPGQAGLPAEDSCCASLAPPSPQATDSCCQSDAPAPILAEVVDANADAACCGDGHDSCHCQQSSTGVTIWQPGTLLLTLPVAATSRPGLPFLPLLEGDLAPPEQPPRA